jgi:glycosyltransferase involved in cell wall biosynthesis
LSRRALVRVREEHRRKGRVPYRPDPQAELSGVVYTTVVNPFDPRKNWQDLVSAFLLALGDREDATLVLKLVLSPDLAAYGLNGVMDFYQRLSLNHRCRLVFITAYLSEAQMVQLARASTYYVNASRAEGACLPLQDFLAAGRPGIAPIHTALADYFREDLGLVVASHPEPAPFPHDPRQRCSTTWHRLVWQALHDQLRSAYDTARGDIGRYRGMGRRAREAMTNWAGREQVWPRLAAALELVAPVQAVTPVGRAS